MRYELGTILEDDKGIQWAIVGRKEYTASAHNDRWRDAESTLKQVSKDGKRLLKRTRYITTDDVFREKFKIIRLAKLAIDLE